MLKPHKSVTGFTLIEILVALLVVSVGLLGVATLQVRGQQFNQVAYFRTQAAFLAHDIMERMRINSDRIGDPITGNGDDGGYATMDDSPANPDDSWNCPKDCDSTCDSMDSANVSSPVALKTYDRERWCGRLQELLPAAEAQITWDGTKYDIFICWTNILDGINGNCKISGSEQKEQQKWSFQPQ
jgi:type IV pilus assembly protein PilV